MAILERIARSFICCKKRGIDNGRGVTVISLQRQRPMTVWGNRVVRWRHLLWRVKASWRQGMGMRKNKYFSCTSRLLLLLSMPSP
ncbi:hypothetical protein AMTR_s00067p00206010 [Amborella trichopoda]|uniref:Uncharacterized protein n=1 Tax=Amborella trichopoda TaxID=13333 RepID=U5DBZ6_AMBTC|nr:hypothetical protein AMTR_s00067p00206010 [Amborella trichopoda]